MQTLESIYQQHPSSENFCKNYATYLSDILARLDFVSLTKVIDCFYEANQKGRTIFFAGNGGSAATASHFAQDITEIARKAGGKHFRTLSLNDHAAALTAISNDYDYSQVFTLQMASHFQPNDVLVVISASGNSPNVVKAVEFAKERQGKTIGLVGFDGGRLSKLCDIVVCATTAKGEYGPVEDVHLVLNHMITAYLTLKIKNAVKSYA